MDRAEIFENDFTATFGEIIDEQPEESYIKQFQAHAEFKAVSDDDELIVEGHASTKHEDRHEEVIVPRAYRSSIADFRENGVILYGHNAGSMFGPPAYPIGVPLAAKIDGEGLYLKARIENETPDEQIVASKIRRGLLKSFSVGFITKAAKWVDVVNDGKKRSIRMITDLELLEVSVVPIPANRQSVFSIAKALNSPRQSDLIDLIENEGDGLTLADVEAVNKLTEVNERLGRKLVEWRLRELNKRITQAH